MKTEQKSMREREKAEEGTSEVYFVSCNVHDSGCQGKKVLFIFFLLV